MDAIRRWFSRYMNDPQVVSLALVILGIFAVIFFMGDILAPVLASVVIAYLLEGFVGKLQRQGVHRLVAVIVVFTVAIAATLAAMFGLVPLLSKQINELVTQFPDMVAKSQAVLLKVPENYPELMSVEQANDLLKDIRTELTTLVQTGFAGIQAWAVGALTLLIYLVLIPLLVFFLLKDKAQIMAWFVRFLPDERKLADEVWSDVNIQIANYIRGKFIEILIVWSASFIAFSIIGLNFSMLLSLLVGLSVIIPYIGATVVTIPVALVALFQANGDLFMATMIAYGIIQALDGNLLVPLLFSEVVNLHPVAIIVAILIFGGWWGFWGVFFAIPLATVVQAILKAWPDQRQAEAQEKTA